MLIFISCSKGESTLMIKNKKFKSTIKPDYLKSGDTIAIIAPSGVLNNRNQAIENAKKLIVEWGLVPIIGKNIYKKNYHFAGNDKQRLDDLQWAFDHKNIKAIWCARGGYGSIRIIDQLSFDQFKKYPKWLIGYSDITVLHNKLNNLGFETIHGMMAVNMEENQKEINESIESLKNCLFGELKSYHINNNKYNRIGKSSGILVGGNLTLLVAQLGSSSEIDTKDKILFIEEIGEYKYHIDRMLQSLKRAGFFDNCNGVLIGDMSEIKINSPSWGSSVNELIYDVLKPYKFPISFGIQSGHLKHNESLIFGRNIDLDVKASKTIISF
ncbi:MAG: LD-carboxypeptidase [Flavobacteriaceae bacterium]|jgi:muramoyltetrapeptide carboxypeptidase|tara:strand:+ start:1166 stop:2143 length:978 start_codon:yes stop_codon:yes gene_type:complete